MSHVAVQKLLISLHSDLNRRPTPERTVQRILALFDRIKEPLTDEQRNMLLRAGADDSHAFLDADFKRPDAVTRQIEIVERLLGDKHLIYVPDASDPKVVRDFVEFLNGLLGRRPGDEWRQRLDRAGRARAGVETNSNEYNRLFRATRYLEGKLDRLEHDWRDRRAAQYGRSLLASELEFCYLEVDPLTAAFVGYSAARRNRKSHFTIGQERVHDEVAEMLLAKCFEHPLTTNWWAVAHVYPVQRVLRHLTDEQKGQLLGITFTRMREFATGLEEVWASFPSYFVPDRMTVMRGMDSTRWNVYSRAWNAARGTYLQLAHALHLDGLVDSFCPGKTQSLMAADLVYMHAAFSDEEGATGHADTKVWAELPRPWDVMLHGASCTRELVAQACVKYKLDPYETGWAGVRGKRGAVEFTSSRHLVHGVEVSSPELADLLRRAGVFSGKDVNWGVLAGE